MPARVTVRVGKMKRKFSIMSITHSVTLIMLLTRILPSHLSMAEARLLSCMKGMAKAKMRK